MLTLSNTLHSSLQGKHVFVDSSSLVHARDSKDFYKLLHTLADNGSLLFTVPSVRFEFTRYANTIMEYNEFNRFINGLSISVFNRVEEVILDKCEVFTIAMNKSGAKMSYTDALLCSCAFFYRASKPYILTANHKDMPLSLFDRKEVITFDVGNNIKTEALYQINDSRLEKVLKQLS